MPCTCTEFPLRPKTGTPGSAVTYATRSGRRPPRCTSMFTARVFMADCGFLGERPYMRSLPCARAETCTEELCQRQDQLFHTPRSAHPPPARLAEPPPPGFVTQQLPH